MDWIQLTGSYEHDNEPSGCIKNEEFDCLNDCQLLKDYAPFSIKAAAICLEFGTLWILNVQAKPREYSQLIGLYIHTYMHNTYIHV
jgi:hypothetical protein